jgi:Ni/Co efflux regulator RcnB
MAAMPRRALLVLIAFALAAPCAARAQTAESNRDVRSDAARERRDQLRQLQVTPPKEFDLSFNVPFTYNTNADQSAGSGAAVWHWSPDVSVGWRRQFADVRLSARADLAFDRYPARHDLDADEAYLQTKAEWTDGRDYRWVPYASYRPTVAFAPTLEERTQTLHDVALGLWNMFYLDDDGTWVGRREARRPGSVFFGFDVQGGYRFSDPDDFSAAFVKAKLPFRVMLGERVVAGVQPTVQVRWYPDYKGVERRDIRPGGNAGITWAPEDLDGYELSLGVQYVTNVSTRAKSEFSQWDLGPTLSFRYKF